MGFFSSIGDFVSDVAGGIGDAVSGVVDWVGDAGGDVLGFAGDVAGGLMGMNSANNATSANAAYNSANLGLARTSLEFQKQYARNRLQWAKEDAQKAGFHPMVAAGLAPTSFSPVQASFTPVEAQNFDWVGKAGQSLSYAASKAKTNKQQSEMWNYTLGSAQQQLRSLQLDNTLKELEIASMGARLKQQAGGPAAPNVNGGHTLLAGQNDSPFMDKPIVRDGWLIDEKGRKIGIIPSDPFAQRTEDKHVIEWLPWAGSAVRAARGKYLGQEVAGHWWHGEDKGFLPYPPKNSNLKSRGSFGENVRNVMRFYRDYDYDD